MCPNIASPLEQRGLRISTKTVAEKRLSDSFNLLVRFSDTSLEASAGIFVENAFKDRTINQTVGLVKGGIQGFCILRGALQHFFNGRANGRLVGDVALAIPLGDANTFDG